MATALAADKVLSHQAELAAVRVLFEMIAKPQIDKN
jgi:hypothetical protein